MVEWLWLKFVFPPPFLLFPTYIYLVVVAREDEIRAQILAYFEEVKGLVTHQSYVIDFIIRADGTSACIELNPFNEHTG